jgi:membrane protease YdiL (CAAX protease family)
MLEHSLLRPAVVVAALLTLLPFIVAAFFSGRLRQWGGMIPERALLLCPALLCVPYALVAESLGGFRWAWFALYAALPVAIALLLREARRADPVERGNWQDFVVLATLGLAVDLRWFEGAWPARMAVFNKMLLLDAGIYGFLVVRQLSGVGFDLRLRWRDVRIGLRELLLYMPIALPLGLGLGFLHLHGVWPRLSSAVLAFVFTFFFIAVPEELFFRGWLQNLLERRIGGRWALFVTAVLFGLSHFNKRAVHFNWRYVVLAALAGIFYGRAWRAERRVGASAVTHVSVDVIWSLWLR